MNPDMVPRTTREAHHFEMYTISLSIIGVTGTVLNVLCILFNLLLIVVLYKRPELLQNPFFKVAGHLIAAEMAISIAQLLIIPANLFTGIEFQEYYYNSFHIMAIPNSIMMLCYDCYYYLQFLIAVYRFMTIHHRTDFFDKWTMHVICAVIWVWCLFEGVVMMTGYCAKMYRPRRHYVGLICADQTTDRVDEDYFRYLMVNLLEVLNFALPVVAMCVYFGLYVKICVYRATKLAPVNVAPRQVVTVTSLSLPRKIWLGITQKGHVSSKGHMRIVYQGLFMILLLAGEPLFNVVFSLVARPINNVGYQIAAYAFIYSTTPTNFLVFYVFNSQMRKCINTLMQDIFGWKTQGTHLLRTISANTNC